MLSGHPSIHQARRYFRGRPISAHSCFNAVNGSTPSARREGNHAARRATTRSMATVIANVQGSRSGTWYNRLRNHRVAASDPSKPIRIPAVVHRMAWANTRLRMLPDVAPRSSPCLADTTNHEKGAGDGRPVGYRLGAPSRGMEIVSCLERLWRQPARL